MVYSLERGHVIKRFMMTDDLANVSRYLQKRDLVKMFSTGAKLGKLVSPQDNNLA